MLSEASWDPACDGRAIGAVVPWHGLLTHNNGPGARPPRHALYSQRLGAPITTTRGGGMQAHLPRRHVRRRDGCTRTLPVRHIYRARVDGHGRRRWSTRSAAAARWELRQRLVWLPAPVLSSLAQPCRCLLARSDTPSTVGTSCLCDCCGANRGTNNGISCACDSSATVYTSGCDSACNSCPGVTCPAGSTGAAEHVTRGLLVAPMP